MAFPPPLTGLRVVELAGLAPVPYAGLLLADFGATVLRIDQPHPRAHSDAPAPSTPDLLTQSKRSVALNLKKEASKALLLSILAQADVLIEPFRPGVLESLGLAPELLLRNNPRLIVARLTGFRRDGKYKSMAGHDINYLAVSGVLSQLGRRDGLPYPPANVLADFAGGGLMCAFGVLLAIISRSKTGRGQVVESNMVDGVGSLGTFMRLAHKTPWWDQPRGENALDGGCPWYNVYETRDGGVMAVGALEPQFFAKLVDGLDLDRKRFESERLDKSKWAEMQAQLSRTFKQKTRKEWEAIFDGTDACVTPVLDLDELESEGYEIREAVTLKGSPPRGAAKDSWKSRGLGVGVGGEEVLGEWMGWSRGTQYRVEEGALAAVDKAKL